MGATDGAPPGERHDGRMETWEYMLVPLEEAGGVKKDSEGLRPERLDALGAQGWEAVRT